jgi:hypothetical protein
VGESVGTQCSCGSESAYPSAVVVEHTSAASTAWSKRGKATAARCGYSGTVGVKCESTSPAAGSKFSPTASTWCGHCSTLGERRRRCRRVGTKMIDKSNYL